MPPKKSWLDSGGVGKWKKLRRFFEISKCQILRSNPWRWTGNRRSRNVRFSRFFLFSWNFGGTARVEQDFDDHGVFFLQKLTGEPCKVVKFGNGRLYICAYSIIKDFGTWTRFFCLIFGPGISLDDRVWMESYLHCGGISPNLSMMGSWKLHGFLIEMLLHQV